MFSDMHSVRSVPTSSKKRPFPRPIPVPSVYSPSEHSPLQSHVKAGNWRSSLHPEIEEQYNRIIRGETLRCSPQEKPAPNGESTRKSESLGSEAKREYEERIKQLEEQNHSLKEELYYLREALLINFSQRAQNNHTHFYAQLDSSWPCLIRQKEEMQRRKQTRSNQKESEYEVDRILDKRMRDGMVAFKIQWKGFPASEATWEPVENLQKCKDMIIEFEKNRKEAIKAVRNHSISKQSLPAKSVEKKKEKPVVEPKKSEEHRKTQARPVPKPNSAVPLQQPPAPPKNTKQQAPLAQSRVKTLFSAVKGEKLRTSQAEPQSNKQPNKGKLASSQAGQDGKAKKSEFTEQANLKRSLASHVRNQDEDYEPDNSHGKGRKMQKTMHYVDEDALPAQKTVDPQKIAEKLINRFGQKPKDKAIEPRDNSNNLKERQSDQQESQIRKTLKEREPSKSLKLEDDGQKRAAPEKDISKNLLAVSRMSRQAIQDINNTPPISLIPRAKSMLVDMFRHMNRYSILDEYLILHKRMGVLNIINKDLGGRPEKPRIKMLQVGNYKLVEEQLKQVKRINRETTMEKLQSLIKFDEGWVAVGKNKHEGLFMMDVNLLQEHVWKVIKDMYKNQ